MRYRLELKALITGLPWKHDFDSPSEAMAIETSRKWLRQNIPSSAMGAYLWDLETEQLVIEFWIETSITVGDA